MHPRRGRTLSASPLPTLSVTNLLSDGQTETLLTVDWGREEVPEGPRPGLELAPPRAALWRLREAMGAPTTPR